MQCSPRLGLLMAHKGAKRFPSNHLISQCYARACWSFAQLPKRRNRRRLRATNLHEMMTAELREKQIDEPSILKNIPTLGHSQRCQKLSSDISYSWNLSKWEVINKVSNSLYSWGKVKLTIGLIVVRAHLC